MPITIEQSWRPTLKARLQWRSMCGFGLGVRVNILYVEICLKMKSIRLKPSTGRISFGPKRVVKISLFIFRELQLELHFGSKNEFLDKSSRTIDILTDFFSPKWSPLIFVGQHREHSVLTKRRRWNVQWSGDIHRQWGLESLDIVKVCMGESACIQHQEKQKLCEVIMSKITNFSESYVDTTDYNVQNYHPPGESGSWLKQPGWGESQL